MKTEMYLTNMKKLLKELNLIEKEQIKLSKNKKCIKSQIAKFNNMLINNYIRE